MYQIYCDNVLIGDSQIEELCVINPIAELEVNASGWFTFTFPATHPHINTINPLTSVIKVLRDNKLIFQGFCSNPSEDIFGNKTITCEGELSYFNDSILRQAKYTDINARTLLETYINLHNAQVEPRKQFTLGRVNNDFVAQNVYCFTNMQSTLQEIKEDLIDDFGGYISVRYENGVKYIDYLNDSDSLNSQQTIELGKNLITYNSNIDNTVIATRVIPLGAQLETEVVEGLPARLDIKSVNDNKDYLDNATAISNFGTITRVVTWDDVTVASNLKAKGEQWLLDNQFENVTIDVTAIDLSIVDSSFQPFQLFDKVRVISRYHGMDRWFMISKVRYDLANPERDTYTLGKTYRESLTVKANNTVSNVEKVREETSGMETSWLKKAKQQASDLISGVDGGYVVLNVDNQGRPFELLVMDAPTKETARKVWRWNQNGFGYSSTGYNGTYGTAITMNGEIVADYIKAGVISGIEINNGNGTFRVDANGNLTATSGTFSGTVQSRDASTGRWITIQNGDIRGNTGHMHFAFQQVFPDATRDGVLIQADSVVLKGRIATEVDYTRPGNASTLRNVLVRLGTNFVEQEFTVEVGGQTGTGSVWIDTPVFEYAEVTENGIGNWQPLSLLNFVNGLLCAIDTYYPI